MVFPQKAEGEPGHLAAAAFPRKQINFCLICLKITNKQSGAPSKLWVPPLLRGVGGGGSLKLPVGTRQADHVHAQSDSPVITANNCIFLLLNNSVILKLTIVRKLNATQGLALEKVPLKCNDEAHISPTLF